MLAAAPHLILRPIRPSDKALLVAGLAHMSLKSVHARFLSAKPKFTAAELRYLTEVDNQNHVALVAFLGDRFAGVGRFVRDPERPDSAEVGIVIADEFHGRGYGTTVGIALAQRAKLNGITHFTAIMLPENAAALSLFKRISAHLHTEIHDGVRELVADLAA